MALFDELKDRASDVVQVAGKKVEDAYSATKLKIQIADKQSAVRTLYRELGELVYENSKKAEPEIEAVEDKIAEIDLVLEGINELKDQERGMKKLVLCPACSSEVDEKAKFCPQCGSEMN
ncbi:MAG: zinc ribbon domain-containing protein [Clostridia bacterium]|nr:zinc ribbon domain-containing protein [Clostridia bacterium]